MNDLPSHSFEQDYYTQIDEAINFAPLNKAFVLKSGRNYPTKYFSIKWEGYVVAYYTETYRFSIEAFAASEF